MWESRKPPLFFEKTLDNSNVSPGSFSFWEDAKEDDREGNMKVEEEGGWKEESRGIREKVGTESEQDENKMKTR